MYRIGRVVDVKTGLAPGGVDLRRALPTMAGLSWCEDINNVTLLRRCIVQEKFEYNVAEYRIEILQLKCVKECYSLRG